MSVSFIISDEKAPIYVPVATENFYNKYWLPKAVGEELYYLSQLGTGVPVNRENVEDIIEELNILADKVMSDENVGDEKKELWLDRLNLFIDCS